jgi:hypothetical protein
LQLAELSGLDGSDFKMPLTFHSSLYFVTVTIFTVGYGDIYPSSTEGQIIVVVLFIVTVVTVPSKTSELLRLMKMQSKFRRMTYKSTKNPHVIVSGSIAP